MSNLYSLEFMHYFKNPINKTDNLSEFENIGSSKNLSCGDQIDFGIKVNQDDKTIESIKYAGVGCIVSMASAEMLSEKFARVQMNELSKYTMEEFLKDLGFELTPSRQKCALIAFSALKSSLENYENK